MPPSLPPSFSYSSLSFLGSALLDYPFVLPALSTSSGSHSLSSSPESSPHSLSTGTDESAASDFDSAQWRPEADCAAEWPAATATATASHSNCDEASVVAAAAVSTSDRHVPHPPSLPVRQSSRRVSSSSGSTSSGSGSGSGTSPTTPSPTSTHSATQIASKRKRTDTTALDPDERLQRRRAQHRAVDANRRQKENDAIARLHRLIRQQQQEAQQQAGGARLEGDVDSETGAADDADDDDAEEAAGRKAGRLTVLESSIALIEQLTTACKRMETACNAKDAQVSHVSSRLHSVAAAIAQQATALAFVEPVDGYAPPSLSMEYQQPWQQALMGHSAAHTHPHVQPHLRSHSHAQPPPYAGGLRLATSGPASSVLSVLPPSTSSYLTHSDLSSTLRQTTTSLLNDAAVMVIVLPSKVVVDVNQRFLDMAGHRRSEVMYQSLDEGSMNKNISQYPASLAAVEEVMNGSKQQGSAVWRCRMANGVLYECAAYFFGCYDEALRQRIGGGREKGMPDKMLIMCATDQLVIVSEELTADVAD